MYHYVRPLESTRFPRIKGLRLDDFRTHLDRVTRNYHPVTVAEIVHCNRSGDSLAPRALLLTFDDGYSDHYAHVFPMLHDRGIQGAFFPPVAAVKNGVLLDANRIHFLLAALDDPNVIIRSIDDFVAANRAVYSLEDPTSYWARWGKADRLDDARTVYIKKMIQVGLPEEARSRLAKMLFQRHVTADEAAFARELYVKPSQLREMQANGMYVGSHANTHRWLNSLTSTEQAHEVDVSLSFLRDMGSPVDQYWVMCYPHGAWDVSLLDELRRRKCDLGFTADVGVAEIGRHDPLLLPRIDARDF